MSSLLSEPPVSLESCVLEVLRLRESCTQTPSEESVRRICLIREICKKAETLDSAQVPWRRGSAPQQSHGRPQNRWRGPPQGQQGQVQQAQQGNQGQGQGQQGQTHEGRPPRGPPSGRYVSKFTNSETPVEEKILNQVILNKLNKFSGANYEDVKSFLQQILDSDEQGFLRDFMLLVFKKAACEPTFCPLYARMISELSVPYPSLLVELKKLYDEYMAVFEEVSEDQCKDYEQFVQRNREKLHRLGYSQFLGELTSYGVLELDQLKALYVKILDQLKAAAALNDTKQHVVEEYVDCLFRMTGAFQKGRLAKLTEIRRQLGIVCEPVMEDILTRRSADFPGLTKKASFAIMDCLDIFRGNRSA